MSKLPKATKKHHLLAVRVKPATMKRLIEHCARQSAKNQRQVSYREVVEQLIGTL